MESSSPQPLPSSYLDVQQDSPVRHQLLKHVTISHVLLIILGYLLLEAVYNLFFHPLRNVPGPLLAKLGQTWRNHKYFRGTWHDDCVEVHAKYGNVVRIAPNELSFVDEAGLKSLYGHGRQVLKVFSSYLPRFVAWLVADRGASLLPDELV